jgi:enamine deaminase RidA (YjgF/YER057c/UK114 family)
MTARSIQRIETAGPFVGSWAYSRAVRAGDVIEVSGTTAVRDDGSVAAHGDVYGQTKQALETIAEALQQLGASLDDVIRTRVFLRDINQWPEAGRAHQEAFAAVKPASSCIGGLDFLMPEILVEVEVTALIASPRAEGLAS